MNGYPKIPIECFMTEPPREWYKATARNDSMPHAIAFDLHTRDWRIVPIHRLMADYDGHKRFGNNRRFPWMLSVESCPELDATVTVQWSTLEVK